MIFADPTMPETKLDSSVELLLRAQAGDSDALEGLLTRYLPRLQRWARRRLPWGLRTMLETADLVQDAVINTLPHLGGLEIRSERAFEFYLKRAIKNRIIDLQKRNRRRPQRAEIPLDVMTATASPEEVALRTDEKERYRRALARLKDSERQAIVLRVERGLSYEEVAIRLGKRSPDAARMAVSRAIVRLADIMAKKSLTREPS
jgi:RNA polymerase sigma factor (sigma-70 family)